MQLMLYKSDAHYWLSLGSTWCVTKLTMMTSIITSRSRVVIALFVYKMKKDRLQFYHFMIGFCLQCKFFIAFIMTHVLHHARVENV